MKKIISLLLVFAIFACTEKEKEANFDESQLKESLTKDPVTTEFSNLEKQITRNNINGKYNMGNLNLKIIQGQIKNNIPFDELVLLYKKAGMKNAEEYFTLTNKKIELLNQIQVNHPELKNLEKEKQVALIRSITEPSLNAIVEENKKTIKARIKN
jgi:hypothetical protein